LEQAVTAIVKITTGAREAIAKLEDIQRVVSIAANLVNLGDAIAAGNPEGILKAVQSTKDSLARPEPGC
jgi:acyl-CoA synthetase (NDP forming)